ncbi:MAG: cell wall metabolism sensor histidine kinase WalK [Clostridiales bacterium]|nr:cell wall metabolism sensor histidine kinase WalK [Clostridiales bacterium]
MFQSMFDRLLALYMVVILLVALIGGAFSMLSIRTTTIENRMESLLTQAREIAFLAGNIDNDIIADYLNIETATMAYLRWKAQNVYEEYGAYILIVDRNGRILHNMQLALQGASDALQTLDPSDMSDALKEVLKGMEYQARITPASKGAIFTVAVPCILDDAVVGAVFIHTSAQVIEAEYRGLFLQISVGFTLAAIVAMFGTAFYTRGIVKPLTVITSAAESMSRGNLNTRAEVTGVNEIRQLAGAFNVMAEKLEQVEAGRKEFVANVSHELRSPVTSIHGFVDGMLDGTIPPEEYNRYLQIVSDETNRMKRLITDLLQLSRMDNGVDQLHITEFDINELTRRVLIGHINDIEQKNLNVQLNFCYEPCAVRADNDRISQVMHNIVDNALKFVMENGNLTITTSLLHDSIVGITVENDGDPISQEDMPHLFDRFYKADKAHTSGKGTGLGLSICKQIMQMHGQTIMVLPRESGAAIRFTLQAVKRLELPQLEA